jgi:uncharacterized protein YkwD
LIVLLNLARKPKKGLATPVLKVNKFLTSSSEDEIEDKFEEDALKAHNTYRAKHGVGPLKLDKKVITFQIIIQINNSHNNNNHNK